LKTESFKKVLIILNK